MVASVRAEASNIRYVLLSDVHLGADLVQHVRPWSRDSWLREQAAIDQHIEGLFQHYTEQRTSKVCFVVAGDFVDFIGMCVPPPESGPLSHSLTEDERAHGLGSSAAHAELKTRAVAVRHQRAFRAMAAALVAGHSLVIVRGNHDIEWHWGRARRAFVEALCAFASHREERRRIRANVEFRAWFYHVPGLLFVEHGHEYDPMCSYGDPLQPVCARDRRRIRFTPSHALMRYVARPTPGLSTFGHEHASFATYVRVAASFGCHGSIRLFLRFLGAAVRLLRGALLYRRHGARLERRRAGRFKALARRHSIDYEVLTALTRLHTHPVAHSVSGVLRSLYLDRIALIALTLVVGLFAFSSIPWRDAALMSLASTTAACAIGCITGRGRDLDPSQRMRAAAGEIAQRLSVRYVVMGHTHTPCFERTSDSACYVNLGNWGDDELREDRHDRAEAAPCTFLELSARGEQTSARLMRWDPSGRPVLFSAEPEASEVQGIHPELPALVSQEYSRVS